MFSLVSLFFPSLLLLFLYCLSLPSSSLFTPSFWPYSHYFFLSYLLFPFSLPSFPSSSPVAPSLWSYSHNDFRSFIPLTRLALSSPFFQSRYSFHTVTFFFLFLPTSCRLSLPISLLLPFRHIVTASFLGFLLHLLAIFLSPYYHCLFFYSSYTFRPLSPFFQSPYSFRLAICTLLFPFLPSLPSHHTLQLLILLAQQCALPSSRLLTTSLSPHCYNFFPSYFPSILIIPSYTLNPSVQQCAGFWFFGAVRIVRSECKGSENESRSEDRRSGWASRRDWCLTIWRSFHGSALKTQDGGIGSCFIVNVALSRGIDSCFVRCLLSLLPGGGLGRDGNKCEENSSNCRRNRRGTDGIIF